MGVGLNAPALEFVRHLLQPPPVVFRLALFKALTIRMIRAAEPDEVIQAPLVDHVDQGDRRLGSLCESCGVFDSGFRIRTEVNGHGDLSDWCSHDLKLSPAGCMCYGGQQMVASARHSMVYAYAALSLGSTGVKYASGTYLL